MALKELAWGKSVNPMAKVRFPGCGLRESVGDSILQALKKANKITATNTVRLMRTSNAEESDKD
jgi:hypothetical protein